MFLVISGVARMFEVVARMFWVLVRKFYVGGQLVTIAFWTVAGCLLWC